MAEGQLRYALFFTADATQAKAAAAAVEAALEGVSAETRQGAAAATHYSEAIEASAAKARAAAVAAQGAGVQMRQVGAASALSAGQVGNLTAQFNDIGMMLMAGQNPLQLAIQQGTQITQVIGPMGASGAVRALGSAFMGMLNPVSLVTIGSIAAGAAMVQWLSGGREDALSMIDAVDRLADSTQAYRDAVKLAQSDTGALVDKFGTASPALITALQNLAQLDKIDALDQIDGALASITESLANDGLFGSTRVEKVRELLDLSSILIADRQALGQFIDGLDRLKTAASLDQQRAAAEDLRRAFEASVDTSGRMTTEQREFYRVLNRTLMEMEIMAGVDISSGVESAAAAAARLADQMQRAVGAAIELSAQGATDLARARIGYEFRDDPVGRARALARAEFDSRTETLAGADSTIANIVEQERREYVAAAGAAEAYRQKTIAARKAAAEAAKTGSSKVKDDLVDAERLYDETRSAAEKYAAEVERINALHARFPEIVTDDVQARALDRLKEKYAELGHAGIDAADALRSAFDGIFDDPQRALENLATELFRMAAYQQLASSFPTMFGAGGFIPLLGRAEGGPISGPGTSTSDSILMWASDGEYMVNAASTARYRPLLEAINADKTGRLLEGLPKRASGGIITSSALAPQARALAARAAPSAAAAPAPVVLVENYGAEPATAERRTGPNGEEMVAVIVGKQWARGRFDKSARARHGVKPEPVWR